MTINHKIQGAIEALLRKKIGLESTTIGSNKISRAAEKRRLACDLPNLLTYLERLQTSEQELLELIEDVIVPETWFFREQKSFAYLRHHLSSEWLPNHQQSLLKVLSIPCSSGEEPYSIAMTLLSMGLAKDKFRIDAVDISKKALLKAELALYRRNSFRGDDLSFQKQYFQQAAKGYKLSKLVRSSVNFLQGNILDPFLLTSKQYDIIFCRNLLIYLDNSARSQARTVLHRSLATKGLLFLGAVESGHIPNDQFVSVGYPFNFAYRKIDNIEGVKELEEMGRDKKKKAKEEGQITKGKQPKSLLETARSLADRGLLAEATTLCKTYLNSNRTCALGYVLLGEILEAGGNKEQAEEFFHKAIYLEPNHYEALIHLALLKESRGDFTSAQLLRERIQRSAARREWGMGNGN